jgi:4-alpha-glucanotransferase
LYIRENTINNTVRGWFEIKAIINDKQRFFRYLGKEVSSEQISWELTRLAMMSVEDIAIIPMQDILALGEEAKDEQAWSIGR